MRRGGEILFSEGVYDLDDFTIRGYSIRVRLGHGVAEDKFLFDLLKSRPA